jgi:hypothetical protein
MERDTSRRTPKGHLKSPPETSRKTQRPQTPPGQASQDPETPPTERITEVAPRRPRTIIAGPIPGQEIVFEQRPEDTERPEGTLPDAPEEDSDDYDSDETSDEEDMSDLTFEGKADTLDDILTHCQVTFLSKPRKFPDDTTKCGYLAAKFRGKALTWLTKTIKDAPDVLTEYRVFVRRLRTDFDLSDDTKKKAADKKLKTLMQKGPAQSFAIEFDFLADILEYNDEAKRNAFITRLKPEVRKQLIGDDSATYAELRTTAISYDEELFALRNPRQKRAKGKGQGPGGTHTN